MTPEPDPQKIPARLVEVSVEVTVEVTVEVEGCVSHDLMPFPILHRLLAWAVECAWSWRRSKRSTIGTGADPSRVTA